MVYVDVFDLPTCNTCVLTIERYVRCSQRMYFLMVAAMSARSHSCSQCREHGCLCKQQSWCTLLSKRVSGINMDSMFLNEFLSNRFMTSAAGAERLRAYTSEMVAVDISIDADSDISLNYNLVEKDETNN